MLNDIYALTMGGHYESRRDGQIIERGTWRYKGHGNAEITLEASTGPGPAPLLYEVRLHSVERQVDEFQCESSSGADGDAGGRRSIAAKVTGHMVQMKVMSHEGEPFEGVVSVPPETVYDGPSPIWMIHLMMTAPPPSDREVTTPFVRLDPITGGVTEGFFRVWRSGTTVRLFEMNIDGEGVEEWEIDMADDGCPRFIRNSIMEQEIIRVPQMIGL